MRVKCAGCGVDMVVDDKNIPFGCPECGHGSDVLDYKDGARPLVVKAWFYNLEGVFLKRNKKGKKK